MEHQQRDQDRQGGQDEAGQLPEAAAQAVVEGHESKQHHDHALQRREDIREKDAQAHAAQDKPGKVLFHKMIDLIELLQGKIPRFLSG